MDYFPEPRVQAFFSRHVLIHILECTTLLAALGATQPGEQAAKSESSESALEKMYRAGQDSTVHGCVNLNSASAGTDDGEMYPICSERDQDIPSSTSWHTENWTSLGHG